MKKNDKYKDKLKWDEDSYKIPYTLILTRMETDPIDLCCPSVIDSGSVNLKAYKWQSSLSPL